MVKDDKGNPTILYRDKDNNFQLDLARVDYWLSKGAKPSTTVASLIRRAKNPNLKPHHATKAKAPAKEAPKA